MIDDIEITETNDEFIVKKGNKYNFTRTSNFYNEEIDNKAQTNSNLNNFNFDEKDEIDEYIKSLESHVNINHTNNTNTKMIIDDFTTNHRLDSVENITQSKLVKYRSIHINETFNSEENNLVLEEDEEEEKYYQEFLNKFNVNKNHTLEKENTNNTNTLNNFKFNELENKELDTFRMEKIEHEDQEDIIIEDLNKTSKVTNWEEIKNKHEKGKELQKINHEEIDYEILIKNIYREPVEIMKLSEEEIENYRKNNGDIHVRGKNPVRPIMNWYQSGIPIPILNFITEVKKFPTPFPIQCQAIPCLMSGRDVIGIAETGSGKTLAYLLPIIRHILIQRPLKPNEGPIALIIVPSRELAWQIYQEAKQYCKLVKLEVSCVFGGMAMEQQISGIKRGSHIVICTPGRMIEVLSLNNGKLINLKRTTFVVLDEADRMFDLGFEPQITKILSQIRPDRQIAMFSATFHQLVEQEARKMMGKNHVLEIIVGVKGKACGNVEQFIELIDDKMRFVRLIEILRLLNSDDNVYCRYKLSNYTKEESQKPLMLIDTEENRQLMEETNNFDILIGKKKAFGLKSIEKSSNSNFIGNYIKNKLENEMKNSIKLSIYNNNSTKDTISNFKEAKILIFVETVEEAKALFSQLLKNNFPVLVVHSAQDQEDRFSYIEDFKSGFKNILITTSLMARGLDVPDLEYVINFRCPNHFEDYVHRVGRTGRAGNKGVSITFISQEEEHLAEVLVKAFEVSRKVVPPEIRNMMNTYTVKVEKGEARKHKLRITDGRGYKHNAEENLEKEIEKNKMKKIYAIAMGNDLYNENNMESDFNIDSITSNQKDLELEKLQNLKKKVENSLMLKENEKENKIAKLLNNVRNPVIKQKFIEAGTEAAKNSLLKGENIELAHKKALEAIEKECLNYHPKIKSQKKHDEVNSILNKWENQDLMKKEIFSRELEVNHYPEYVRMKMTKKEFRDYVNSVTSCEVSTLGMYVRPKTKPLPGVRKLYLLIKGSSENEVTIAYNKIFKYLENMAMESISINTKRMKY